MDKAKRPLFGLDPDGTCLFGSWNNPESKCILDFWSLSHFMFTSWLYAFILFNFHVDPLITLVVVNLLHAMEEILGNTVWWNFESLVVNYIYPLFEPDYPRWSYLIDRDYLQNSIGDVLVGFIGTIIVYYILMKTPDYHKTILTILTIGSIITIFLISEMEKKTRVIK